MSVALVGELDLAAEPLLDAELHEAGAQADLVVLDLCALSFMDCAELRVVLAADARLRETGGRLVLNNCSRQVRRLFDLARVSDRLEMAWEPKTLTTEPARVAHRARHEAA